VNGLDVADVRALQQHLQHWLLFVGEAVLREVLDGLGLELEPHAELRESLIARLRTFPRRRSVSTRRYLI